MFIVVLKRQATSLTTELNGINVLKETPPFYVKISTWCIIFWPGIDSNTDAKRLYDDLLFGYNKLVRPVSNSTNPVSVFIKLKLSRLIEVVSKCYITINLVTFKSIKQESRFIIDYLLSKLFWRILASISHKKMCCIDLHKFADIYYTNLCNKLIGIKCFFNTIFDLKSFFETNIKWPVYSWNLILKTLFFAF